MVELSVVSVDDSSLYMVLRSVSVVGPEFASPVFKVVDVDGLIVSVDDSSLRVVCKLVCADVPEVISKEFNPTEIVV